MHERLDQLNVNRAVYHFVPGRNDPRAGSLDLSGRESILSEAATRHLQSSLRTTLINSGCHVEFDPSANQTVSDLVLKNLTETSRDLINDSQVVAQHLWRTQAHSSPSGMLVIAECHLGTSPAFVIAKLDFGEGTTATPDNRNGQRVFAVEHIDHLMLTGSIFKAALFVTNPYARTNLDYVEGCVSDTQTAWRPRRGHVADYFLRNFLGCKLQGDPALVTQLYFDEVQRWLNTAGLSSEKQANYLFALLADMNRQDTRIDVTRFVADHLELEDQDNLLSYLVGQGISTGTIPKDMSLVGSRSQKATLRLNNGITLYGSGISLTENFQVTTDENGDTVIRIRGEFKDLRGRG